MCIYYIYVYVHRLNFFSKPSISRYQPPDWQLLLASKGLSTTPSSSAHKLALTMPFHSAVHNNNNTINNVALDNQHHTLTATSTTSYCCSSLYLSEEECMNIKLQLSNKSTNTSLSSYQLKDDELVFKLLNLNWKLSTNRDLPLLITSTSSVSHNDRALVAQKHAALRLVSSGFLGGKDGVGRLVLMAFLGSLVSVLLEVMYILPVTELARPQRVITDLSLSWHSNEQLWRQYIKSKSLPTTTELKQHLIALWLLATATGAATISTPQTASNATTTALHSIENAVTTTAHASIGVANESVAKSSVLTASSSSLLSMTALLNSSLLSNFLSVQVEPEPELILPTPPTFEPPVASMEPWQGDVTEAVDTNAKDLSLAIKAENVVAGTAEAEGDEEVATILSSLITSASSYFYTLPQLPPHIDPPTQEHTLTEEVDAEEATALVLPTLSTVKIEAAIGSDTLPSVDHLNSETEKEVVNEVIEEDEEDYVLINKSEFDNTSDDETVNPSIHSTLSPPPPISDINRGSWLSSTQLVTYIIDRKLFPGTRAK